MIRRPPRSTLFPYPTLSRSVFRRKKHGPASAPPAYPYIRQSHLSCTRINSMFGGRMEPLIELNCPKVECTSPSPNAPIWQDVLAQAMTGELLAAMNYAALAEICDDPAETADALEHATNEPGHAARFAAEGRRIGIDVQNNVDAMHWKRLRDGVMHRFA